MTAGDWGVRGFSLPRSLHPVAWWLWALGLATAASRTTNPLLLAMIVAVAGLVVANRRGDAPWAMAFRYYLIGGAVIVALRVLFRIVFGGGASGHILFSLPEIPLPRLAAGIRLFGPVDAGQLLGGLYDGLRLATMLVCLGAANALANPKRMLRAIPSALYEVGTAVVVALTVAPQLVESVLRVRRARRLRGGRDRGPRALRSIAIPVLVDAMDRSLRLAAAMDSRGYGRSAATARLGRAVTGATMVTGLLGLSVGVYAVLEGTAPRLLGVPMLAAGALVAAAGLYVSGHRIHRTVYRPDHWRLPEFLVAGCGLAAAVTLYATATIDPTNLYPSLVPLTWPTVSALPMLGILVAGLPARLAPPAVLAVPVISVPVVSVPVQPPSVGSAAPTGLSPSAPVQVPRSQDAAR